ncbi:MAG: hypothetical protein ACI4EH_02880 [Oliverpabstia sp.]
MGKRKSKLFMIIASVLCVLLFLQRLTGGILHAVFGMVLLVMMVVHLCSQKEKLKHKRTSIQAVDWLMIATLTVLIITGVLLHPLADVIFLKILHKLASVLLVLGILGHILQHT